MSFGNNVLFYRRKCGITQEELAEKLEVTRQTVSRWETDNAFPDMEKLLTLCEIFGCNMDVLVRGNAEEESSKEGKANLEAYDKHMNMYSVWIVLGVCLILAGVTAMLFFVSFGVKEIVGVVALLACITLAVSIFIASGISHGNFMRENPHMDKYPETRVRSFRRKFPFFIAGATSLILIGVIAVVTMTYEEGYAPKGFTVERWESFAAGILLLFITIAVGIYVGAGMQWSKYDVKSYNKDCLRGGYTQEIDGEDSSANKEKKGEKISGAICSAIMLSATAIYLVLGFIWYLWHPGWVVFPVGGILCGIVSVVVKAIFEGKQ